MPSAVAGTIDRSNVAALIPAYFEEKRIADVARRTLAQLDTVLVVDDGSSDATEAEAQKSGAQVHPPRRQPGQRRRRSKPGCASSNARPTIEYILILDGDGQHLPEEIADFPRRSEPSGAPMMSWATE